MVVDFKPGDLPVGPKADHKIPAETVRAELTGIGWTHAGALDLLPYQYVHVFTVP